MKSLKPWESIEFPWGIGVRHRKGVWTTTFLFPDAQEINLEGLNVKLNENGIFFLEGEK